MRDTLKQNNDVKIHKKQDSITTTTFTKNIKYVWLDSQSIFVLNNQISQNSSKIISTDNSSIIEDIVRKIEVESGIKKSRLWLRNLIFVLMFIGGMILAFFLIRSKKPNWGFLVIILTMFGCFFLTIGYSMI